MLGWKITWLCQAMDFENPEYLQSNKTLYNIKKKHKYTKNPNKEKISVIYWENVEEIDAYHTLGRAFFLSWNDKVKLFQTYIPTYAIVNDSKPTYILVENKSKTWGSDKIFWLRLNQHYAKEWFFWFVKERLSYNEDFLDEVKHWISFAERRRAGKKMEKHIREFAVAKFHQLPNSDERTIEDLEEEVGEALLNLNT